MRPLRFLLTLVTSVTAFFFLLLTGPWATGNRRELETEPALRTFFDWRSASSLFPPSAIISLTDDNSTFFLARPAAFGPLLPTRSLSGQLWIGGGFGDDHLGRGGSTAQEGELGCSDVPGWDGGSHRNSGEDDSRLRTASTHTDSRLQMISGNKRARRTVGRATGGNEDTSQWPSEADGTDDHLHHPLPASDGPASDNAPNGLRNKPLHADIQSLQESAEIAGKIVLLSRGGCGFLEKTKWVQRRGGVALIVGDNVRGGPLVTMYARSDTSNVTIPALFTSHTTAHLLTSLVPTGGSLDSISEKDAERLGLALGDSADAGDSASPNDVALDEPTFTTSTVTGRPTKPVLLSGNERHDTKVIDVEQHHDRNGPQGTGWFGNLFRNKGPTISDNRGRPTGWVPEEFDDVNGPGADAAVRSQGEFVGTPQAINGDGFVIGVQDWRDPDLVAAQKEQMLAAPLKASTVANSPAIPQASQKLEFEGGSITPGSGEYVKSNYETSELTKIPNSPSLDSTRDQHAESGSRQSGRWFGGLFKNEGKDSTQKSPVDLSGSTTLKAQSSSGHITEGPLPHDGLWVTLTPTSMSSSPFFDTLLVLVVSPLVTLTVVYALLLLRSRIRRRRWRAPKSVVERLPVRTYQTMTTTTSNSSALSSPVSATTPLLPPSTRDVTVRPRPRSRTVCQMPVQPSSSLRSDSTTPLSLDQIEEKRAAGLAEWRRRYGGKQRECVVCLEEYVDGVSRVMSLPCGHEFHADCITPWLTTRRRTCPICKGDVVRSLARASTSNNGSPPKRRIEESDEDDEDDASRLRASGTSPSPDAIQEQAASTYNMDPDAARPIGEDAEDIFDDIEQGIVPDRNR